jgi:hypothetical protein
MIKVPSVRSLASLSKDFNLSLLQYARRVVFFPSLLNCSSSINLENTRSNDLMHANTTADVS